MSAARTSPTVVRVTLIAGRSARESWEFVPGRSIEAIELGTDAGCDWQLEAPGVAPRHARLAFDGTSVWLSSIAADAGVLVDGGAVGEDWVELHVGSALSFGAVVLCAEAAAAHEHDVPNRPTEPPKSAPLAAEATLLVQAPDEQDATEPPLEAEATRIELPLPPGTPRERSEMRTPSPLLGSAASGVRPVPAAALLQSPPATTSPLDTTDQITLRPRTVTPRLLIALALVFVVLVGMTTLVIGVWRWIATDEPQALATTPEAVPLRPVPPTPSPIAAGALPEAPPLVEPALPGEGSELSRAVALVAEGRLAEAALAYETLARRSPERPEFGIAARALRARAQGGTR